MKNYDNYREHLICAVETGSIADELGLKAGDALLAINDNEIVDFVDYNYFSGNKDISLVIRNTRGETVEYEFEKDETETLGLEFENPFMDKERHCKNKCVFCFIDQMPKDLRKTLYFKDDDWRLSLLMGNYTTFTNVDESELKRIIERRVSPLYISVHATEQTVRAKLLGRGNCDIMPVLKRLAEEGIAFHCQIVLCPGINDGAVLERTLEDLYALGKGCASVAIVPVGMTKFRWGLSELTKVDERVAKATLKTVNAFRSRSIKERGDWFAFASDEIYIVGKTPIPTYEEYGDFDQIEDGIGMCAMFKREFEEALADGGEYIDDCGVICGTLAKDYVEGVLNLLPEKTAKAVSIENDFFGRTITVTGLLTGGDIIRQIKEKGAPKNLFISENCLKRDEPLFLDGVSLEELKEQLFDHNITVVNGGYDLAEKMRKK